MNNYSPHNAIWKSQCVQSTQNSEQVRTLAGCQAWPPGLPPRTTKGTPAIHRQHALPSCLVTGAAPATVPSRGKPRTMVPPSDVRWHSLLNSSLGSLKSMSQPTSMWPLNWALGGCISTSGTSPSPSVNHTIRGLGVLGTHSQQARDIMCLCSPQLTCRQAQRQPITAVGDTLNTAMTIIYTILELKKYYKCVQKPQK